MKIYLQKDGKQAGPFRDSRIRKQLASGELTGDELAWHKSITQWQPLREIFPVKGVAEKIATGIPMVSTPLPVTQPASATASPPRRRLSVGKKILLVVGGIFALLGLLVVTVIVIALIATRNEKFTSADIQLIHAGMKASEVESILGKAQSRMTSEVSGSPSRKETICVYGKGDSSVAVRYDGNDRVVSVGGEASSQISTEDEHQNAPTPEKASGKGPSAEPGDALQRLRQAADGGDADAQYQMGMSYWKKTAGMSMGDAGNSQYARDAEPWFRKAAEQGHAAAQFKIGDMYWRGWGGLPMDHKEAGKWIRKAAEQGNADGQWQLGEFYQYGRGGLARNMVQAVALYQKAAEQGQADAQFALGDAYEHGMGGLPKDIKKAKEWYHKAADQGNELAKQQLE